MQYSFYKSIFLCVFLFQNTFAQNKIRKADVIIYGGTSAAITAAVQVKKMGKSVIVVSPDKHLGGLSSGGLGFTDTGNKKVILIHGQVEDDASIKYGALDIKTNLQLLKKVRDLNKNAYIVYKPHPDILASNRKGFVDKKDILKIYPHFT